MVMRVSISEIVGPEFMAINPSLYGWDEPPRIVTPEELAARENERIRRAARERNRRAKLKLSRKSKKGK